MVSSRPVLGDWDNHRLHGLGILEGLQGSQNSSVLLEILPPSPSVSEWDTVLRACRPARAPSVF